jgi:integrase
LKNELIERTLNAVKIREFEVLKNGKKLKKYRADAGMVLGKRTQSFFDKQKDAEVWLKQQEKIKRDARLGIRRITSAREQVAAMAFEMLEKHGLEDEAILDAVKRYCSIAAPHKKTSLKEAITAFERDLEFGNRSPVYITQIGRQLARFQRSFEGNDLHEISGDQVRDWLEANCETAANRANRRRELRVFFSWCRKQGLITDNPVDRVPRVTVESGKPDILTVNQVKSALKHLEDVDRGLFAVSVFAGLRPSEAEALQWEHVKLDRGFLEVVRSKTRDRRNVALSTNLVAWLKPLERDSGPIFGGHTRRWRDRVQKAIANPDVANVEAEPLPTWPQDVLRHTYGSYHLEKHHNAAETAHQMGHQGNPRMLFNHYRDLVTPEDATAFWEIMPR